MLSYNFLTSYDFVNWYRNEQTVEEDEDEL